jgi:hypothetical protein
VFYGAAEFSRDCYVVVLADQENLVRLGTALEALGAVCIAVPPFEKQYLDRGHAVHFRCRHPEAMQMRLDVMTKLRGCGSFEELWERRLSLHDDVGVTYDILGIEDLVRAKQTQRDKDWPMIRRLVDAHYDAHRDHPSPAQVQFWLRESRTPSVLIELAQIYPDDLCQAVTGRALLKAAQRGDEEELHELLAAEASAIRNVDREYWRPSVDRRIARAARGQTALQLAIVHKRTLMPSPRAHATATRGQSAQRVSRP